MVGVFRSWTLLFLPWLALNIMLILGLGAGVMYLLATNTEADQTMKDVRTFLLIIILMIFLVMSLMHLLAVVQVLQSIKEQKGQYEVSDGENVIKKKVIEDQLAGESLVRENRYRVIGGSVPDSSFDSCDDVP